MFDSMPRIEDDYPCEVALEVAIEPFTKFLGTLREDDMNAVVELLSKSKQETRFDAEEHGWLCHRWTEVGWYGPSLCPAIDILTNYVDAHAGSFLLVLGSEPGDIETVGESEGPFKPILNVEIVYGK